MSDKSTIEWTDATINPNDLVQISTSTPDAVKGCSYIYAPAGQAGEYTPLAANPYRGCGHGCSYCYVPGVLKMKRDEFDAGANARPDYLEHLTKDARKYQAAGITEQVFFSFTTDVYSPFDTSLTRPSLQIVQNHGMGICVLTKGGSRALADIDLYRPDRDCFASTLTSLDDAFSKKWERNAAPPDDRIATLKAFYDRGVFTWVSLEPTLDVESSLAIVEATHGFVDLYKIGRANYLKELTRTTDWEDYTHRMIELCGKLGVAHYIKKDLQPYLPAGYNNPLRIQQHHGPKEPTTMELISPNTLPTAGGLATTVAISPVSQEGFQENISENAAEILAEYECLDADINERTTKWQPRFADVMAEFEEEILPLLEQMNSLLSYHGLRHTPGLPGWGAWYEKFRRSINLNWHMRKVQRKLAKFRGEPTGRTTVTRGTKLTPEQASAAKLLDDAKQELGAAAAAGNEPAAAIIAEYEEAYTRAMAGGLPAAVKVEAEPVAVPTLAAIADRLTVIARELGALGLNGFADVADDLAERVQDREELNKRMDKLRERMAERPAGWRPNSDMLMLQLRRDRRYIIDMKNILSAGGTTYRGQKIWGKGDDVFIKRYTREEIQAELDGDRVDQLGVWGKYESEDTEPPVTPLPCEKPTSEEIYKLLAPLIYHYYFSGVMAAWDAAVKAYEATGEPIDASLSHAYYENYIVRSRPYKPSPEIKDVPWPRLKVDTTVKLSSRLGRGSGPPMWLCITEPNGDTVECSIDRAGDGKCTRVRRIKMKGTAATNDDVDAVADATVEEFVEVEPDAGFVPPKPSLRQMTPKVGRNDQCPCESGKKYKKCHGA